MRAFTASALRQMRANFSRFLALTIICAVGVTMAVGLKASCDDLRASADAYFDKQHLFDLRIQSTLGLNEHNISALSKLQDVDTAVGSWDETVSANIDGSDQRVSLYALIGNVNEPYLLEGRLPRWGTEIAITQRFAQDAGLSIGDTCSFSKIVSPTADKPTNSLSSSDSDSSDGDSSDGDSSDDDSLSVFSRRTYQIVGIVYNPADVSAPGSALSWRASSEPSYAAYTTEASVRDKDTYTTCYLQVSGASKLNSYSEAYTTSISRVRTLVQSIAREQEDQRTQELRQRAQDGLDAAKAAQAYGLATSADVDRAQDALDSIELATWYIQDRSSLSSYASIDSDARSIESLGAILPIVFLAVAILVSLTSITRMVEEERSLAGLWKALGYGRARIMWRYISFALIGSVCGTALGWALGYGGFPSLIFSIFSTMYTLPVLSLGYTPELAFAAFLLFAVGISGAALITCLRELAEAPAQLMRPKAPKAGARLLLERIGWIWSRLRFLTKVCFRNIFRYKQRFFMTVVGIAGCCALLVMGFGIRDTVQSLSERQYGSTAHTQPVISYDLMVVARTHDDLPDVCTTLANKANISSALEVHVESVTVGDHEAATLIVAPDPKKLSDYLALRTASGAPINFADSPTTLTINTASIIGAQPHDSLPLQLASSATKQTTLNTIGVSYLGNYVVMTPKAAKRTFGKSFDTNALLVKLADKGQGISLADTLTDDTQVANVVSTARLQQDFSSSFKLINTVVYLVIALAAALSLTVVYTLSVTNVAERERELATIKVLGFRPREVRRYINSETLVLTGIGTACGLPLGWALTRSLTVILQMPGMYFDAVVAPTTYLMAAALTFAFTGIVLIFTNHLLTRIDMVGALKSTE